MRKFILAVVLVSVVAIIFNGCGKKEGDEPTKYMSQAGLEKLTKQAAQKSGKGMGSFADNPRFLSFQDKPSSSDAVKDLDSVIRPVLVQLFGAAKLIEANDKPITKIDKEVVLNSIKYVVRRRLVGSAGNELHAALLKAHFSTSPRLGSKPTITDKWALMSLFKSTSRGSYSLEIRIDVANQTIKVESYQLGSKYDRLM